MCLQSEILVLGGMKHENLVRLIGYCCENGEGILVYEFMPQGSLEDHLFPGQEAPLEAKLRAAYLLTASLPARVQSQPQGVRSLC